MSVLKRLSATLFARIDDSVRRIENHDAVIAASIQDARRMAAQTKVRINRVRADGEKLTARLESLRQAAEKWKKRAAELADRDENSAIECLSRNRDCREKIAALEQTIAQHKVVEKRLCGEAERLQQKLDKIVNQRNLMRSRQSAAEVNRCLQEINGLGSIDIDDTFERWEVQITEAEMAVTDEDLGDELERRLESEELRAELLAELKTISSAKES